jgi:uncharacterized membrane protein YtjA (UPF0391 family)
LPQRFHHPVGTGVGGTALQGKPQRRPPMLHWSLVFLVIALIAAVFGFTGIAATSAGIARILFGVFLILFLISFVSQFLHGM